MTQKEFRPFLASEWASYRDARLAALLESPDAFGSTYEVSRLLSDAQWRSRLADVDSNTVLPLGAFHNDQVAGIAWVRVAQNCATDADLFQMWVAPEFRGQGLGRQLLDVAIKWTRDRGLRTLKLAVTIGATPAWGLYLASGFRPEGEPQPLRDGSELMVQPMVLPITVGIDPAT